MTNLLYLKMSPTNDKPAALANSVCTDVDNARKPLARLRCVKECLESLKSLQPFPSSLCYVPAEVEYELTKNEKVAIYSSPAKDRTKLAEIFCTPANTLIVSGEEMYTSDGHWGKLLKVMSGKEEYTKDGKMSNGWILLCSKDTSVVEYLKPTLLPVGLAKTEEQMDKSVYLMRWEEVIEHEYALRLRKLCQAVPADCAAVDRMRLCPPGWTLHHYEQLTQLLLHVGAEQSDGSDSLGDVKEYIDTINVSSQTDEEGPENLTDANGETYWESDGSQGTHWIRLKMKPGTIIRKLILTLHSRDDNYVPHRIIVMGGESYSNLRKLNEVTVDHSTEGLFDVMVLAEQTEHIQHIEIRIKECQDGGIDARVHGIKIKSSKEKEMGLNRDLLEKKEALVRFPKLAGFDTDTLYQRSLVLLRLLKLVDSVLSLVVPRWEYSLSSCATLEVIRELMPLSRKRLQLVEQFLRESESAVPGTSRKVFIDRRIAMEHRCDPSLDPNCQKSVFCQLFEGLKPHESGQRPLDYRWPSRHHQWWECKFIGEGIIDQGGGFRDSISDLSEELCPSSSDSPLPLPFFIRTPNQSNVDATSYRDLYVPNPSCTQYHKFEWIGKLMGACFRSKENLVLFLPSYIWKKLCGQPVSWNHDFITVDEAQVKLLGSMENMDEEAFKAYFGDALIWNTTLSDGTVVQLKPVSDDVTSSPYVSYERRMEYIKLVEQARMNENQLQTEAIQRGLMQVIPQAALELLSWHEVEKRICGDPEITIEALRQNIILDELNRDDMRIRYLWEVLEKFSNEDRSRFLRFVTGRRRLPVSIHVMAGDGTDKLPTASTCGSVLMLPRYTSSKVMEEKLRYAAYNCIAIDTDMSAYSDEY